MSRRRDNYENSRWRRFMRWLEGEIDPLTEGGVGLSKAPSSTAASLEGTDRGREPEEDVALSPGEPEKDVAPGPGGTEKDVALSPGGTEPDTLPALREPGGRGLRLYRKFYQIMSIFLCLGIICVLLWTIAYLPAFGNAGNPDNNEVSARYIEKGLEETGAVNMVTGMILDYRAFDTFGESCVLFIASCCVLVLLRIDDDGGSGDAEKRKREANDRVFEPKNDIILQKCACVLVPVIMVFGIYIILNGHLSPGGGFSGGAVLGSGLILYLNAFGFQKTEQMFNGRTYRRITVSALTFYCLAKSYSFFTGANHMESGIPLGTPGDILSSGLILPLNICVGLVVACTMYAFYTLFRKGGI